MRSPEDFPADIIAAADAAIDRGHNEGLVESVCRALMERDRAATETEREACAKIAEKHMIPGHAVGVAAPMSIAAAIRSQP
jgi:hypothetical protein